MAGRLGTPAPGGVGGGGECESFLSLSFGLLAADGSSCVPASCSSYCRQFHSSFHLRVPFFTYLIPSYLGTDSLAIASRKHGMSLAFLNA